GHPPLRKPGVGAVSVRGRARRGARVGLSAAVLLLTLGAGGVTPARAGTPLASFGPPSGSFIFGTSITFSDTITLASAPLRVELLLGQPGAIGPEAIGVPNPGAGPHTVSHVIKIADGHVFPNTVMTAQWRVTDPDGTQELGSSMSLTYLDTRFSWQTKNGPIVHVHWYDGDASFGARALAIGEQGIANASALLGVTETKPVDFYIYADTASFYDALGPGTRENVGGEAVAQIRTLFALITPDEVNDSWVSTVIPHELTHLVFNTAIDNPYHSPPRWLNEGLAVYLSEGYTAAWRSTVADAVDAKAIIPLDGLVGQFPTTADQFSQAYGESVAAVDFMIRTYGKPALVKLIRSYAGGVSDDEAFQAALGVDTTGFNAAWLKSLGVATPKAYGPQPAPAGPQPPGWNGSAGAGASGVPGAIAPGGTESGSSVPVVSVPVVSVPTNAAPAPADASGRDATLIAAGTAVLTVGLAFLVLRAWRRRSTGGGL
ncbi:MAG TPA: peptidase MA family metallohydrolase, partial [Candidatus Limnocylindrales bacterium]|nr:peptidase MA family metallohydrolase [Candidatus Limnocylindrales bacterium]